MNRCIDEEVTGENTHKYKTYRQSKAKTKERSSSLVNKWSTYENQRQENMIKAKTNTLDGSKKRGAIAL